MHLPHLNKFMDILAWKHWLRRPCIVSMFWQLLERLYVAKREFSVLTAMIIYDLLLVHTHVQVVVVIVH